MNRQSDMSSAFGMTELGSMGAQNPGMMGPRPMLPPKPGTMDFTSMPSSKPNMEGGKPPVIISRYRKCACSGIERKESPFLYITPSGRINQIFHRAHIFQLAKQGSAPFSVTGETSKPVTQFDIGT